MVGRLFLWKFSQNVRGKGRCRAWLSLKFQLRREVSESGFRIILIIFWRSRPFSGGCTFPCRTLFCFWRHKFIRGWYARSSWFSWLSSLLSVTQTKMPIFQVLCLPLRNSELPWQTCKFFWCWFCGWDPMLFWNWVWVWWFPWHCSGYLFLVIFHCFRWRYRYLILFRWYDRWV